MNETAVTSLSYEKAQQELRELVEKMEGGDLPLEDLLQGYERATALRKHCEELLNNAEQRVQVLLDENGEQSLETETGEGTEPGESETE